MVNNQTNVCDNVCLWDGNPNTWSPPSNYLMLIQATTLAKVWVYDFDTRTYYLEVQAGQGQIGYTWDGVYLITNEPQPIPSEADEFQPVVSGAQVL